MYTDERFNEVNDLRAAIEASHRGERPPPTYHGLGDNAGIEPLSGLLLFFGPDDSETSWCATCVVINGGIRKIVGE